MDQAQYRELESFAKFGGEMDPVTAFTIDKGRKNTRLLIQPQHSPMPVEEQIAILYCATKGLLKNVPIEQVHAFERRFLETLRTTHAQDVLAPLRQGLINAEIQRTIEEVAAALNEELGVRN